MSSRGRAARHRTARHARTARHHSAPHRTAPHRTVRGALATVRTSARGASPRGSHRGRDPAPSRTDPWVYRCASCLKLQSTTTPRRVRPTPPRGPPPPTGQRVAPDGTRRGAPPLRLAHPRPPVPRRRHGTGVPRRVPRPDPARPPGRHRRAGCGDAGVRADRDRPVRRRPRRARRRGHRPSGAARPRPRTRRGLRPDQHRRDPLRLERRVRDDRHRRREGVPADRVRAAPAVPRGGRRARWCAGLDRAGLFFLLVGLSVGGYASAIAVAAVATKLRAVWTAVVGLATAGVVAGSASSSPVRCTASSRPTGGRSSSSRGCTTR